VSAEGIAPDSPGSRSDQSSNVTINSVNPRINNCSFWNAGPNGIVEFSKPAYGIYRDDKNLTNRQTDVNSLPAGNITYFLINASLFGGSGIMDLESVRVTAWFDNYTPTSNYTGTIPNREMRMNYSFNTGLTYLTYPTTGEVSILPASVGFTNGTIQEVAIPFRMGPNIRWAPGDGSWNTGAEWNDGNSWDFQCQVLLDAGGNPSDWGRVWHYMEFGTYKYTSMTVALNPMATYPPGSGWQAFSGSPDQTIDYRSNAPMKLQVNISNLLRIGGGGTIFAYNLGVSGELQKTMKPFWGPGPGPEPNNGYNYFAGRNGTTKDDYAYINSGNWNLTGSGPTAVDWYVSVPLGTMEGLYRTKITWLLSTATDASPA
jgi:hypothetical protein